MSVMEADWTTSSSDPEPSPNTEAAHQNEGFLKSAWHRLTHQHDNLEKEGGSTTDQGDKGAEEPKRASGSG